MRRSLRFVGALAGFSLVAFAAQPGLAQSGTPGQTAGTTAKAGKESVVTSTVLTFRSYVIGAFGSQGNLEGNSCPAFTKLISGACHPFYNSNVTIINQFPNIPLNTWRCGFRNNTAVPVTVFIYTLCDAS
jgi:hypothetical protein